MLNDYKVIIWDFDGVLMRSNDIRTEGFRLVLKDYPEDSVEKLIDFHLMNGGLSRYFKFQYFFTEILNQNFQEKDILRLAANFSSAVKVKLIDESLLIDDSLGFIRKNQQLSHYIASGSDQEELKEICMSLRINNLFVDIKGSPMAKSANVAEIIKRENVSQTNFCLIGDSINDFEAAENNNIDFYGFNNDSLINLGNGYLTHF